MYDEGQLTDIVVEVDHGKTFSCHRNVLAAISPYFRYDDGRKLYYYPSQYCPLGCDTELGQINKGKQCVCFLRVG